MMITLISPNLTLSYNLKKILNAPYLKIQS